MATRTKRKDARREMLVNQVAGHLDSMQRYEMAQSIRKQMGVPMRAGFSPSLMRFGPDGNRWFVPMHLITALTNRPVSPETHTERNG